MISLDYILMRRLRMQLDLIPGPPHHDKTLYSAAIQVIARYPADEVAGVISSQPGMVLELDGSLDARAWRWKWVEGKRSIQIGFSTLDDTTEPSKATWGGSSVDCDCLVGDLVTLWQNLRKTHSDIWLLADGKVYTPFNFVERIRDLFENHVVTFIE